jgi:hypothetical protein
LVDALPASDNTAEDLGVADVVRVLPYSVALAIAPAILAIES